MAAEDEIPVRGNSDTVVADWWNILRTFIIRLEQGGGGGGSLFWNVPNSNAPLESFVDGFRLFDYDKDSEQVLYLDYKVSDGYQAGNQIKLAGGLYCHPATSGNVLFQAKTTLVRAATTVLGTYPNQHTSVSAEQTVEAVANTLQEISEIDLTDASGEINSVAVQAGDLLLVEITRKTSAETLSADGDARLWVSAFKVTEADS